MFQAFLIIFWATIRLQGWGDAVCDPSVGNPSGSQPLRFASEPPPLGRGADDSVNAAFYCRVNIFAHAKEILIHFAIRYAQNRQAITLKSSSAFGISCLRFRLVVLRAVKLYHEFRLGAIKIDNIVSNYPLTIEFHIIQAQELKPKFSLFLCHVFSERSCCGSKAFIMFVVHV